MAGDLLNHTRNCIRDELKRCLSGCKYYNVYCGAIERFCGPTHITSKKAGVNIKLGNEVVQKQQSGRIGGGCAKGDKVIKLEVILEVYAMGCDEVEYFLDSCCAEVQRKLCNCVNSGGVCHSLEYEGTVNSKIELGDQDLYLCRVIYEATYIASPCNMSQYKPMGCK